MSVFRRRPAPPIERQLRAILARFPNDHEGMAQACERVDDWRALLVTAHEHGVAAVVLTGIEGAALPPSRRLPKAATRSVRLDAVWQDVLCDTLHAVLEALREQAIPAVVLKGPILAARLYDGTLRPSIDLDVLVNPASLDAAIHALLPLGYEPEGGPAGHFYRSHHHHVHMLHPSLPVLELHFDAYRGFGTALPAAPLFSRSIPCEIAAWHDARVLAPEDEFLYLAVHAASHRFQRLVWLLDLKLLALRHLDLRWDLLAERAEAHKLSPVVSFTCALLTNWLATPSYGLGQVASLGAARFFAAERLACARSRTRASAVADFLFSALLCDGSSEVASFSQKFLQRKALYEAPERVRAFLSR